MTQEERRQYAREYRAEGFGRVNDKRYREAHREEYRKRMRELMRKIRKHRRESERAGKTAK